MLHWRDDSNQSWSTNPPWKTQSQSSEASRRDTKVSPIQANLVHHGVRITDSAIVAAAVLSNRYITDRNLPDKAIDLIDEAAASLRMEMDSLPAELDAIERQIRQLEIERQALKKEPD